MLVADAETGLVIPDESTYDGDELIHIYRIDISEWLDHGRKTHRNKVAGTHDILDFGYWYTRDPLPGFAYEPPAYAWREGLARNGWDFYPIPPRENGNFIEDMPTIMRILGSSCYHWQCVGGRFYIRRAE